MAKKLYEESYIIDYNEGDRSLERVPIEHDITLKDSLHIVKQDDTLESIAAKYYGVSDSWYIIADINDVVNPFELVVGASLIIPHKDIL